jgi:sulfate transport system ATP-binding protein
VFVRPHELEIERYQSSGACVAARIHRIQSAGPIVRVELTSDQNGSITVEMTHERYRDLTIKTGETVFVKVRDTRTFFATR